MLKSPLKLFFLIYFSVISGAFSQVNNAGTQYNNWLKKVKLSSVLVADELPGPNNTPKYAHLILRPTAAYKDPLKFALTWHYLNAGFKERGIDLDSLLINKLACYAFLPLQAVSVEIITARPDFSIKISYVKKLPVSNNMPPMPSPPLAKKRYFAPPIDFDIRKNLDIRKKGAPNGITPVNGDVAPPVNFDFGAAANLLRPYRATTSYNNINIVFSKLKSHFLRYHHLRRDTIEISQVITDDANNLIMRVSKIYHHIIRNDNLHESVLLNIKLKSGEIYYSVEAVYAPGGGQTPDPIRDYKVYNDIMRDFPEDWLYYTTNLPGELTNTLNGK